MLALNSEQLLTYHRNYYAPVPGYLMRSLGPVYYYFDAHLRAPIADIEWRGLYPSIVSMRVPNLTQPCFPCRVSPIYKIGLLRIPGCLWHRTNYPDWSILGLGAQAP